MTTIRPTHILTGKHGERLSVEWLRKHEFKILFMNWRCGREEIDIVAQRKSVTHLIEVKTRRSLRFGHPEESMTVKKLNNLRRAAEKFMLQHPDVSEVQVDLLAVILQKNNPDFLFCENILG